MQEIPVNSLEERSEKGTPPGRIASFTNKLVQLVSSPLRYAADTIVPVPSSNSLLDSPSKEEPMGMVIDEEIIFTKNTNLNRDHSVSGDLFFSPAGSNDPLQNLKNISKESVPVEPSRSFSIDPESGAQEGHSYKLIAFDSPLRPLPSFENRNLMDSPSIARETELLQEELSLLNTKYEAALRTGHELRSLLAEYEQTLEQIVEARKANKEQLSTIEELSLEKRQISNDLQATQIAFANLRQRHEELRSHNESLLARETSLKARISALSSELQESERNYALLKEHAEAKLQEANYELHRLRSSLEVELSSTKAKLHKAELRAASLESTIDAKTRENAELMTICDELIQKMDATKSVTAAAFLQSLNP